MRNKNLFNLKRVKKDLKVMIILIPMYGSNTCPHHLRLCKHISNYYFRLIFLLLCLLGVVSRVGRPPYLNRRGLNLRLSIEKLPTDRQNLNYSTTDKTILIKKKKKYAKALSTFLYKILFLLSSKISVHPSTLSLSFTEN